MKILNYLDVNFNLNCGTYKPYTKPNNEIKYIHKNSNHPPSNSRQIPLSIESRLLTLSFNENIFQEAVPTYQNELQNSSFRHTFTYKRPKNDNSSTNINKITVEPPLSGHPLKRTPLKKFCPGRIPDESLITKPLQSRHSKAYTP